MISSTTQMAEEVKIVADGLFQSIGEDTHLIVDPENWTTR